MPDPNPVRAKLAPLADGTLSLRPGYGSAPQPVQVKAGPQGALQAMYSYTAAEEADLQIANTDAVDANTVGIADLTTQVKGLGELVKAQTDAVKALSTKQEATNDLLGILNGYNQQTAQAAQNAAQSKGFYTASLTAVGANEAALGTSTPADRVVAFVTLWSGSLLTTVGQALSAGGATVQLYHVPKAATGNGLKMSDPAAVKLGDPFFVPGSLAPPPVPFGLVLPADRLLRVSSDAGGLKVMLNMRAA